MLGPKDSEAVAWRQQVTIYYRAMKDSRICSSVKHIKEFLK